MRKPKFVLPLALILVPFLHACFVLGGTIYIPDQYPTIQQGIDAAAAGDNIVVRDGTYYLIAALDFKGKAITVMSENGAAHCFLDGQEQTRVVYFHSGEGSASVLSGFTIRNGRGVDGGGISCISSSPTITDCTITANRAFAQDGSWPTARGGGIHCDNSSPTIRNCAIINNHSESSSAAHGGGLFVSAGAPMIMDSVVSGNIISANWPDGAGMYFSNSTPSIYNVTISHNAATAGGESSGGGMYFWGSTPSIVNCVINGNSARHGAGIRFEASSTFSRLTNCTVVRNTASVDGGGLYCKNSSPQIVNSIMFENSPQEVHNSTSGLNPGQAIITYSDVLGGYSGEGNIDAPPQFVNAAQQDFHLASGSP